MFHRCQTNDKGRVVWCTVCKRKRYCVSCMTTWYPKMPDEAFAKACPVCRRNCSCKSCLHLDAPLKDLKNFKLDDDDLIHHSKYIVQLLLPFLKQFNHKQMIEKEREANIQDSLFNPILGVALSEIKLQQAECPLDERAYCKNCKTSIVDFHRSCPHCCYDLCLIYCWEFHGGNHQGGEVEVVMHYVDNGLGYLHGENRDSESSKRRGTLDIPIGASFVDHVKSTSEWKVEENGNIPCPPESMGGCGHDILELKCMFPEDWVSDLVVKVENIAKRYEFKNMPESPGQWCSSFNSAGEIDIGSEKLLKATSREDSDDNYLYSPMAKDIQHGDLKDFQWHWLKGELVIVSNVLETTADLSWEPMVMWRAFRQ